MKNSVVIKGNKYGIIVVLDKNLPFHDLKNKVGEKFKESASFFGKASMGISFEGRKLSDSEQFELLEIIQQNTELTIVCIVDNNPEVEEHFKTAVETHLEESASRNGQFYKGTLRSGQVLESEYSLVILGDVNPGAKVISTGNVIVLGALKGTVYAGITGDSNSFVVALEMSPMQIRIGDIIARSSDGAGRKRDKKQETKIAFVENDNIYIEPLNKEVLDDLRFFN